MDFAKLDRIDERILCILKKEARITNAELASRVNYSASACLRRVQKLEDSGVIEGYYTRINLTATGKHFIAYVNVGLLDHSKKTLESFESIIVHTDEVTECHTTTGESEYLLRIEVCNSEEFRHFHTNTLGVLPQVKSITTHVVMNSPKK